MFKVSEQILSELHWFFFRMISPIDR
jgi:hypothetical protein